MQIQKSGNATQLQTTVKVAKKDTDPKEKVVLGSTESTPDFLKPLANQTAGPIGALGCATLGGVGGAFVAGSIGGIKGGVEAAIGWGASKIFGPTGGVVATVGLGVLGALNGMKDTTVNGQVVKGSVLKAGIGGLSNAAATWMGATNNFLPGVFYGSLVTGVPAALIVGVPLAIAGGCAGAAAAGA